MNLVIMPIKALAILYVSNVQMVGCTLIYGTFAFCFQTTEERMRSIENQVRQKLVEDGKRKEHEAAKRNLEQDRIQREDQAAAKKKACLRVKQEAKLEVI